MKYALHFLMMGTCLLQYSCSSGISFSENRIDDEARQRSIPYGISKGNSSEKLAVLLRDEIDSLNYGYKEVVDLFIAHDYKVLVPGKPGENIFEKRSLDSKEERLEDMRLLLNHLDSLYSDKVIIGWGEGSYLAAELAASSPSQRLILFNAGIQSPYFELQQIAQADSLRPAVMKFLTNMGLSRKDLSDRLENIQSQPHGVDQLPPYSNKGWLSYRKKPMINDLYHLKLPLLWINYIQYPLLSSHSLALMPVVVKAAPSSHYELIESDRRKEATDQAISRLKSFMNWR